MGKSRILIVEDEALVAEDVRRQLLKLHYEVVATVDSGEGAIEAARTLLPDLILMDIQIKGPMNGLDAGRLITEEIGLPIVYVTANRNIGDQLANCVRKPFSMSILASAINKALNSAVCVIT